MTRKHDRFGGKLYHKLKSVLSLVLVLAMVVTSLYVTSYEAEASSSSYGLSNPRIVKDSTMKAGQKVTWDCVWFGSYPQSEVTSENAMYTTLQSATDWDANGDIEIDGVRYRRINKSDAVYTSNWDGYYKWDLKYHYFKYEPLLM